MALISADDVKPYLDQLDWTAEFTTLLGTIAERASGIVETYIDHSYAAYGSASQKTVRGQGGVLLWLPVHEKGSITLVTLAGSVTPITGWVEGSKGDLYLYSAEDPSLSLSWGHYRYTVTAKWGYGPTPEAVKQICIELAVNIWRGKDKGMWQDFIGVEGSGGVRFTGGLNSYQKGVLDGFRSGKRNPRASSSRVARP